MSQTDTRREAVVSTFLDACERPTADDLVAWTRRHPEFADDIREAAGIALEVASADGAEPDAEPDAEHLERRLAIADAHVRRVLAAKEDEGKTAGRAADHG